MLSFKLNKLLITELTKTNTKLQSAENLNNKVNQDKNSFASQLEQLKVMYNLTTTENCKLKEQKVRLDRDITQFKQRNEELEAMYILLFILLTL